MHFTMNETDKQVLNYVSMKFKEKRGKTKTGRYPT